MISTPPQQIGQRLIGIGMILNQKNAHTLSVQSLTPNCRDGVTIRFRAGWECKIELCPHIATTALSRNRSLMRFHERLGDRKAKTKSTRLCSGTLFEGIENL